MASQKEIRKVARQLNEMARMMELAELAKNPQALQKRLLREATNKVLNKARRQVRKNLGV